MHGDNRVNGSFEEHLPYFTRVLRQLRRVGRRVNAKKSSFFSLKLEYLVYKLYEESIRHVQKKIQVVLYLQLPIALNSPSSFFKMVQFNRDMWNRRSRVIAPLTDLVGKGKWELQWTDIYQETFDDIKRIMTKETIISNPKFDRLFGVHYRYK